MKLMLKYTDSHCKTQTIDLGKHIPDLNDAGWVEVEMENKSGNDGSSLVAELYANKEATGINVNAHDKDRIWYLSNAELPSKTLGIPFPVARLYAGDADTESDSPIAIVANPGRKEDDNSKRIVCIDEDFVCATSWRDSVEKLPQTVEQLTHYENQRRK